MTKAKIVYASLTGNTKDIVDILSEQLQTHNIITDVSEAEYTPANTFKDYDICIVATYTYGDGDLPDEIMEFYHELQELDLTGKVFGVCGSGDTMYEHFCTAVDIIEDTMVACNAIKGSQGIKIHLAPTRDDIHELKCFVQDIINKVPKV